MVLSPTRGKLSRLVARVDRLFDRCWVRVLIFSAVFLWAWLFLASGVAHS